MVWPHQLHQHLAPDGQADLNDQVLKDGPGLEAVPSQERSPATVRSSGPSTQAATAAWGRATCCAGNGSTPPTGGATETAAAGQAGASASDAASAVLRIHQRRRRRLVPGWSQETRAAVCSWAAALMCRSQLARSASIPCRTSCARRRWARAAGSSSEAIRNCSAPETQSWRNVSIVMADPVPCRLASRCSAASNCSSRTSRRTSASAAQASSPSAVIVAGPERAEGRCEPSTAGRIKATDRSHIHHHERPPYAVDAVTDHGFRQVTAKCTFRKVKVAAFATRSAPMRLLRRRASPIRETTVQPPSPHERPQSSRRHCSQARPGVVTESEQASSVHTAPCRICAACQWCIRCR